ncbi:MAG: outer membrane lipoprotein-sorting protein [Alkalispirochaeta sp.]
MNTFRIRIVRHVATTFIAVLLPTVMAAQSPPSAEDIVQRLEEHRTYDTSRAEMTMVVNDRFGERQSTMIAYSRGAEEALIEFTSPGERGQKVLRTENEIYLYYPDAAELVRLQGAALRESMLGSDVSYEDLTGGKTLLDTYDVSLDGEEEIDGHPTYRVDFEARRRNVPYPRQTMWIDQELYVARRTEQYALSGRHLKTVTASHIETVDDIPVPMQQVISDELKRNSSTTVRIEELEIGVALDNSIFSLEELSW